MTAVWPTAYQRTLLLNWGAATDWRVSGWIGLFGDENSDNAYFYGDWVDSITSSSYATGSGV